MVAGGPQHLDPEEARLLRDRAHAISTELHTEADLDPLMERIGEARYVLLGEATHGTSEFYTWRTRISQRLIREKGFSFIAVEGDWPDCYRVNRFVKGYDGAGGSAYDVLHAFDRWPTWMWANREVVHLAEWLRSYNDGQPRESKVGFYGLDVYSLWESMDAVIGYLRRTDPGAVAAAIEAYACFEPFGRDERRYARVTALTPATCRDEVVRVLMDLRRSARAFPGDPEAAFDAEQNAVTAVNAERYYSTMVRGDAESWNIRDTHMAETLDRLAGLHRASGVPGKAIIWAHNTHIGDARATDMAADGMVNLGQLARERAADDDVVLVGFAARRGRVIASDRWGEPMRAMTVPIAQPGAWEDILHDADAPDSSAPRLLILDRLARDPLFHRPRGHRAIGVVYHPTIEHLGNYVPTILPERYDALLSFDETRNLHPLHAEHLAPAEVPETYPTGM